MNDIEYIIRKICERRGVYLEKVEIPIQSTWLLEVGIALTDLLPQAAGVFYYIRNFGVFNPPGMGGTGLPQFRISNGGGGSAGTVFLTPSGVAVSYGSFETDFLVLNPGTFSAGKYLAVAEAVYKISYIV
jgi:hypothetical protein